MTAPTPDPPDCGTSRGPGRPRSEASRQAILTAAYELLREKCLTDITSAELARRAGVSKATLYRWWSSKEAVVLEAYFETLETRFLAPTTSDPIADLRVHMRRAYELMAGPDGRIFATLIASGHFHPEVREVLNAELNSPRCQDTERLLQRAVDAGVLRDDLDVELAVSQLYGPAFYNLMTGEPIEPELAERVVDQLVVGLRR